MSRWKSLGYSAIAYQVRRIRCDDPPGSALPALRPKTYGRKHTAENDGRRSRCSNGPLRRCLHTRTRCDKSARTRRPGCQIAKLGLLRLVSYFESGNNFNFQTLFYIYTPRSDCAPVSNRCIRLMWAMQRTPGHDLIGGHRAGEMARLYLLAAVHMVPM